MRALIVSGTGAVTVVAAVVTAHLARHVLVGRRVRGRFTPLDASPSRQPEIVARVVDVVLRGRRRHAIDRGLPAWLDAAARAARSGASLRHALVDGASIVEGERVSDLLAPLTERLAHGASLGSALDGLAARDPTPSRDLVLRALRLAAAIGGPATPVLDAVASTLHERAALTREVRALSSQARASAAVMVAAPVLFAVGVASADPRVAQFFSSPSGLACVAVGVALDVAGAAWMARVVRVTP